MRTLLITNDFPPRPGGIQRFVHSLAVRFPADSLVVYSSDWRGSAAFDAEQPFPVIRENTKVLLPTPRVARPSLRRSRGRKAATGCGSALRRHWVCSRPRWTWPALSH